MKRAAVFVSVIGLWLAACQPVELVVEVTRLVETAVVVTADATPVSTPALQTVEVTRVVPQEVTRVVPAEVIVEVTKPPLGSADRPIQLLFPPGFGSATITGRGAALAAALTEATGRRYEIGVPDSEQALIELMCMAPVDTIGFLSPLGYVIAHDQCGVQIGSVALHREGMAAEIGMIVTRRDSGILELADLADGSWAVPDETSVPNFLYFQAVLSAEGIAPGELQLVPGDNSAMLAVFDGEADFATGTYVPPILPYEERAWTYGEDGPEPWRALGIPPTRSPIGYVLVLAEPEFGGYRLRDARSGIFDARPGIYNESRVVALSAPIPNEAIALGPDFPLGLARQVVATLTEFGQSAACETSLCAGDFYGWTGLEPAVNSDYDSLRFVIDTLGLTEDEIWALVRP